jgi:hypothetical protein
MQLLVTPAAAAEAIGVSKRTIFAMLEDGRLTRHHVPGVRGTKVSVAELERIARGRDPEAAQLEPMSDKQRSALNAKCRTIDTQLEQDRGVAKQEIYHWASSRFGRMIDTSEGLTWQEAHEILDELEERVCSVSA